MVIEQEGVHEQTALQQIVGYGLFLAYECHASEG